MAALSSETIHATSVSIDGRAVLLTGPSGIGKSDLALRLIDRGAVLVSDDYTLVMRQEDGTLVARAPETIAGRLEVRHIGILPLPYEQNVPVVLVINLSEQPERLPERRTTQILAGVAIPSATLAATEASTPIKVELLLQVQTRGERKPS